MGETTRWTTAPAALALGAALLLFVPTAARAQDGAEAERSWRDYLDGLYVGVAASFAITDIIESELSNAFGSGVGVDIAQSWGTNAQIGYRVAPYFAVELEYEWIDEFDVDITIRNGNQTTTANLGDIDSHVLTLNAKFIAPFPRVQPFLAIGVGRVWYDWDDNGFDVHVDKGEWAGRANVGVDFYLTKQIVLNTRFTGVVTTAEFDTPDIFGGGKARPVGYLGVGGGLRYEF